MCKKEQKKKKSQVLYCNESTTCIYDNEREVLDEAEEGDTIVVFQEVRKGTMHETRSIVYDKP